MLSLMETYFMIFLFNSNLFVKDVKMTFIQVSSDVLEKGIPISSIKMKQEIFLNVYAGSMKATHVWRQWICYLVYRKPAYTSKISIYIVFMMRCHIYTLIRTLQVVYVHSKFMIPRGITMVLTHRIECCVLYFIPSKNTISSCVVLDHIIGKG